MVRNERSRDALKRKLHRLSSKPEESGTTEVESGSTSIIDCENTDNIMISPSSPSMTDISQDVDQNILPCSPTPTDIISGDGDSSVERPSDSTSIVHISDDEDHSMEVLESIQSTPDVSGVDVDLEGECQCLRDENYLLKKSGVSFCEASFQDNDAKVKFYTGLPSFAVLMAIFRYVSMPVLDGPRTSLTKFELFMMVLLKLQCNLADQDQHCIPFWCSSNNCLS